MPRNTRCVVPGLPYHVTQRGTNKQRVFFTDADRSTYLRLLQQNLPETHTRLLAWCLMSNHVHLILVPEEIDSLEVLLRRVHGRYAQMVNVKRCRTGHLWQNRFFSCALSQSHLSRAVAYVERNPVRAGMVEQPEHYPWSSAALHSGLATKRRALLDPQPEQQWGGPAAWRAQLHTPDDTPTLRLLRRCTHAGRPFGEDEFVTSLEEQFQRRWRRWGFETSTATAA